MSTTIRGMTNTEQSITRPAPGMVRAGQSGGYFVHSFSTSGTWYFVYGQECSCPATVARCKHLKMVDMFVKALDAKHARPRVPTNRALMCD